MHMLWATTLWWPADLDSQCLGILVGPNNIENLGQLILFLLLVCPRDSMINSDVITQSASDHVFLAASYFMGRMLSLLHVIH